MTTKLIFAAFIALSLVSVAKDMVEMERPPAAEATQ